MEDSRRVFVRDFRHVFVCYRIIIVLTFLKEIARSEVTYSLVARQSCDVRNLTLGPDRLECSRDLRWFSKTVVSRRILAIGRRKQDIRRSIRRSIRYTFSQSVFRPGRVPPGTRHDHLRRPEGTRKEEEG